MTVNYGFFPYLAGSSPHDRSYTTITWAKFFGWMFPHEGVVQGIGSNLAITATGTPDMYVHVAPGVAVASGFYWLENTASFSIPIATADPTNPRIDLIVAKFRLTGDTYRDALLTVHTGTPAASPVAPTPTVSADVIEIVLGQVTVAAGATQIQTANITAAASQPLCGFVAARFGKASSQTDGSIDAADLPVHNVKDPEEDTDADTRGARIAALAAFVAAGTRVKITRLTTAGSGTLTTDAATHYIDAIVYGGGASGGGSNSSSTRPGGGGGSGSWFRLLRIAVSPDTGYSYVVGAGGTSVGDDTDGVDGGSSSITIESTTYTAPGGSKGLKGGSSAIGTPGAGATLPSKGDEVMPGNAGTSSTGGIRARPAPTGGGGYGGYYDSGSGTYYPSGAGEPGEIIIIEYS